MLLRTRSCHYENFVFLMGQYHVKDTPIKSVLTKKKKQTNKQKLQPRIEPGLENLTHPITSTLPRRHNSKQEKFDYVIILSYPLVIQSITFDLLFKFSLKKENLILVLLFPVSGGTTRTTFGSFQLQQKLLPGSWPRHIRSSQIKRIIKSSNRTRH